MLQVMFYRVDLKSIHPGYINARQVVAIGEASPAEIDGVIQMITCVRFSNSPLPMFVVGSIDEFAAMLEGVLERGRG